MDIVSSEFKANPFPIFARLRADEPVCWTTLPDKTRVWLLSRYEDVNALFKEAASAHKTIADQVQREPTTPIT